MPISAFFVLELIRLGSGLISSRIHDLLVIYLAYVSVVMQSLEMLRITSRGNKVRRVEAKCNETIPSKVSQSAIVNVRMSGRNLAHKLLQNCRLHSLLSVARQLQVEIVSVTLRWRFKASETPSPSFPAGVAFAGTRLNRRVNPLSLTALYATESGWEPKAVICIQQRWDLVFKMGKWEQISMYKSLRTPR